MKLLNSKVIPRNLSKRFGKKKNFFHFPSLDIKKIEHRQNLDNPRGKKINILPRVPRDVKFRRIRLVHHYL